MMAVSQYKVAQLTQDDHPYLERVRSSRYLCPRRVGTRHGLPIRRSRGQAIDQIVQSLSNMSGTIFIFKRTA